MRFPIPAWPAEFPKVFKARASLRFSDQPMSNADALALQHAARLFDRSHLVQCSNTTLTWGELMYVNSTDFAALASFTSEASLLGTVKEQPIIPANFFLNPASPRRAITIVAQGVLGSTGTPTYTFQVRSNTTAGSSNLAGTSIGVSAAITTASGVTNKYWRLMLELNCYTPGIGTGNTTLSGAGFVTSPAGFASPFTYELEPTTPPTATWTATIDGALTQYINLSVTCSASSSSNTIQCKSLRMYGEN